MNYQHDITHSDGYTLIGGSMYGYWLKEGKNRDTHKHYIDGNMHIETIDKNTGSVIHRSEWSKGRFACGNKEEMRSILRNYERKYPGRIFRLRGYGCDKPGKPIVFEIMEKVIRS